MIKKNLKDTFIKLLNEISYNFSGVVKSTKKLTYMETKELAEFFILQRDIIKTFELSAEQKVLVERNQQLILQKVYNTERISYYSSFYYLPTKYYSGDQGDIGAATFRANIDITVSRLLIFNHEMSGSSENEYYFTRGYDYLLRASKNLIKHSNDIDKLTPALYVLLNYMQSMAEYVDSKESVYNQYAQKNWNECYSLLLLYLQNSQLHDKIESNYQILCFVNKEVKRYCMSHSVPIVMLSSKSGSVFSQPITRRVWVYNSLYTAGYTKNFTNLFTKDLTENILSNLSKLHLIEKIILLRDMCDLFSINGIVSIEGLPLYQFEEMKETSWFKMNDYFKGYNESADVLITDTDKAIVSSLNDSSLREKVAYMIQNIDKNEVLKESQKAHGVYEISDMELSLNHDGTRFYMCLPFKSGREISGKIKEQISYQVLRPFTYFGGHAIVVFVSASDGTESFIGAIKRARINLNLEIRTIMGDALVKLLKVNDLI
ncbi:hypothetical protein ACRYI5_07565 [Furfurilactobacillus sp. WILCCON 0119]